MISQWTIICTFCRTLSRLQPIIYILLYRVPTLLIVMFENRYLSLYRLGITMKYCFVFSGLAHNIIMYV